VELYNTFMTVHTHLSLLQRVSSNELWNNGVEPKNVCTCTNVIRLIRTCSCLKLGLINETVCSLGNSILERKMKQSISNQQWMSERNITSRFKMMIRAKTKDAIWTRIVYTQVDYVYAWRIHPRQKDVKNWISYFFQKSVSYSQSVNKTW